jgi:hypothetical protein
MRPKYGLLSKRHTPVKHESPPDGGLGERTQTVGYLWIAVVLKWIAGVCMWGAVACVLGALIGRAAWAAAVEITAKAKTATRFLIVGAPCIYTYSMWSPSPRCMFLQ